MESAGAFGAGKKAGVRSIGLGCVGRSWREKVGRQLCDSGKGYEKSHSGRLSCLVSEIAPSLLFSLEV